MKKTVIFVLVLLVLLVPIKAQQPFLHLKVRNLSMIGCGDVTEIPIHYDEILGSEINTELKNLPKNHPLQASL